MLLTKCGHSLIIGHACNADVFHFYDDIITIQLL